MSKEFLVLYPTFSFVTEKAFIDFVLLVLLELLTRRLFLRFILGEIQKQKE